MPVLCPTLKSKPHSAKPIPHPDPPAPSIVTFSERLKPHLTEADVLAMMALSSEFESMAVRRVVRMGGRSGFQGHGADGHDGLSGSFWGSWEGIAPPGEAHCSATDKGG